MSFDGPLNLAKNRFGLLMIRSSKHALLAAVLLAAVLTLPSTAFAGQLGDCAAEYTSGQGGLNCTANDNGGDVILFDPEPFCLGGGSVNFNVQTTFLNTTGATRYDQRYWIGLDGGDPRETAAGGGPAVCSVAALQVNPPVTNEEVGTADDCGDLGSGANLPLTTIDNVTVECIPNDVGRVDVSYAITWDTTSKEDCSLFDLRGNNGGLEPNISKAQAECGLIPIPTEFLGRVIVRKVVDTGTALNDFTFNWSSPTPPVDAGNQIMNPSDPFFLNHLEEEEIFVHVESDAPGVVTITEQDPSSIGYVFSGVSCNGGSVTPVAGGVQVTLTWDPDNPDQTDIVCEFNNTEIVGVPEMTLQKSADIGLITEPVTVTYTYLIANTGSVDLTNVTLVDDNDNDDVSCAPDPYPIPLIPVGQSATCTATHTVTQEEINQDGSPDPGGTGFISNTAEANSDQVGPRIDSVDIPIDYAPELGIVKNGSFNDESGDGFADEGETISYTFDVTNTGNVTLTNVLVTDSLGIAVDCAPENNPIADLDPQESVQCTATYPVTQADIDAGQVSNTGFADSNETGQVNDTAIVPLNQGPEILVEKSSTTSSITGPGAVPYIYDVTNTGNVTLTGLTLADDLADANPICDATMLAPGDMTTCLAQYTVTQTDIDENGEPTPGSGNVVNNVTATASSPGNQNDVSDDDTLSIPIAQTAALGIAKDGQFNDDGDGIAEPGETISYTFDVTNTGNVTLTNVLVTDSLGIAVDCAPENNPIADLDPQESVQCTATYPVDQADIDAGVVDNIATANSDQAGPVTDNHSEPLAQSAGILLDKEGTWIDGNSDGIAQPGEAVDYTFAVTNSGNVTLSNVVVNDPLVNPITCPSGNPIPTLAPGASETCTGTYIIDLNDVNTGQVVNTADTIGNPPGQLPPVTDEDTDIVSLPQTAGLQIIKSGQWQDESGDGLAQVGETISYDLAVTNTGSFTLLDTLVVDPKLGAVSCPVANPIPTLNPQQTVVCTGSYVLKQEDIDAGQVDNIATASNIETDDAQDTATVPLPTRAVKTLAKSGIWQDDGLIGGIAEEGETVNYSLVVTNTGDLTLTNVLVTDPLVGPVTCPGGNPILVLAPDAFQACTASYSLTQADVNAGQVYNIAQATSNEAPLVTDDATVIYPTLAALTIDKTGTFQDESGDGFAQVGETIAYTFMVLNTGTVTLTNVAVTDPIVSPITCPSGNPIPSLAPGISEACTGSYTVVQGDVDAGGRINIAFADSDQTDPESDTENVPLPKRPELTLVKSSQTTSIDQPMTVAYNYLVTNIGNSTVTGISLVDDNISSALTCPSDMLAPGATMTCTANRIITQGDVDDNGSPVAGSGNLVNKVTATSTEAPPVQDDLSIPFVLGPAMTVKKSASTGVILEPGPIDYSYLVTNTGNVTLTGVYVDDDNATGESCPVTELAPGESTTCTATHILTEQELADGGSPNPGSGVLSNNVTAYGSSPGNTDDVTATDSLAIGFGTPIARFMVTKDFTDDNPMGVDVNISCNTGLPLTQDYTIYEGSGVTFVVKDFLNGDMDCTITETIPEGYAPLYDNGAVTNSTSCEYTAISGRQTYTCEITNSPDSSPVKVNKVWEIPHPGSTIPQVTTITVWCDAEIVGGTLDTSSGNYFLDFTDLVGDTSITALVRPEVPSSTCWAVENSTESYIEVTNGCGDAAQDAKLVVSAGSGDECTIVNTVFFEGIPTLNQYGLMILALLMLGVGAVGFRRFV